MTANRKHRHHTVPGTAWQRFRWRWFGSSPWSGASAPAKAPPEGSGILDRSFILPDEPPRRESPAVLLIHGLTGTPTEMRFVAKGLANAGFTCYGMQLPGHCGTEADLLRTGWRDWVASVEAAWADISSKHGAVFAAGLSMGAILALHLAARHPEGLNGVALYSPTLRYDGWAVPRLSFLLPLVMHSPLVRRYRFVETFPYGIMDERLRARIVTKMMAGASSEAGNIGMPGLSLRELQHLVGVVKKELSDIETPVVILQASDDDVTSPRNASYLMQRLRGPVQLVLLDECYHMITVDRQRHDVARHTAAFFNATSAGAPTIPADVPYIGNRNGNGVKHARLAYEDQIRQIR